LGAQIDTSSKKVRHAERDPDRRLLEVQISGDNFCMRNVSARNLGLENS
jgi:hypothetical protein